MRRYAVLGAILCAITILGSSCVPTQKGDGDKLNGDRDNTSIVVEPIEDEPEVTKVKINEPYIEKAETVITRALASKMLTLANFDKNTIEVADREIQYKDSNPDLWYDKYINMAVVHGWMSSEGDLFHPLRPLSNEELLMLGKQFEINLSDLGISVDHTSNTVTYEDFMGFFEAVCEKSIDDGGVRSKRITVFATPAVSVDLTAWNMATNYGRYSFEGLALDQYIDKEIDVMIRGNEILAVKGVTIEIPKLTNAYIERIEGKKAKVFMGGISRELTINHDEYTDIQDMVGDLIINKGHITGILLKERGLRGRVLLISNEQVILEGKGSYSLTGDAKFYSTAGNLQWKGRNNVIVGYASTDFILDDKGRICGGIITDKVAIENIRVLISTSGFNSKYHETVEVTSEGDYTISYGENQKSCKANEVVKIDASYFEHVKNLRIQAGDSKLTVGSISRGYGNNAFQPAYRGELEIMKTGEGYLVVNELPVEEYLYAVVPSEMPTSYGLEASKTQAVCARSYAYTQFYSNRFSSYGAHVIDSVSSQVYNNIPENETSIAAVKATSKEGLTYNGRVVSANFYSTSCGFGANSGDVWANYSNKEFPTSSPTYLQAKPQFTEGAAYDDLSDEMTFRKFLTDDRVQGYDSKFSYYRWDVELTREHIEASINANIAKRYKIQPKLIKTLDDQDVFRSRPVDSIGKLVDINIISRGLGGNITEMIIEGTKGVYKVMTEYNIRLLVSPVNYREGHKDVLVHLHTDKEVKVKDLMPSAFYFMDKAYNDQGELLKVRFQGGGYGHGVGMSQNGVKGMVDWGKTYRQILSHYYSGTEVKPIY